MNKKFKFTGETIEKYGVTFPYRFVCHRAGLMPEYFLNPKTKELIVLKSDMLYIISEPCEITICERLGSVKDDDNDGEAPAKKRGRPPKVKTEQTEIPTE